MAQWKSEQDDWLVVYLKCLLFIFNFLFWAGGLAVMAVGVWTLAEKSSYLGFLASSTFATSACIVISAGTLVMATGFLGCTAVLSEQRGCLSMYFCLLFVIFLVELVSGVLAHMYYRRLSDELKQHLHRTLAESYGQPGASEVTASVDRLQQDVSHEHSRTLSLPLPTRVTPGKLPTLSELLLHPYHELLRAAMPRLHLRCPQSPRTPGAWVACFAILCPHFRHSSPATPQPSFCCQAALVLCAGSWPCQKSQSQPLSGCLPPASGSGAHGPEGRAGQAARGQRSNRQTLQCVPEGLHSALLPKSAKQNVPVRPTALALVGRPHPKSDEGQTLIPVTPGAVRVPWSHMWPPQTQDISVLTGSSLDSVR
ncbi:tetraspanin-11 isoform X1 [Heterocephalus glaber]|uniref:Tetraspanin-11 isoform X1 n=1 Tax=Heterocephalus glaber TaxID=10181 RepID=A0AAX6S575_HETGA|nr:tetraspanin-11 isoform X1 [Heterocephalus glaber]